MSLVAIGWDVRGWRGTQQAVAVLEVSDGKQHWSVSGDFQFKPGLRPDLSQLLIPALGNDFSHVLAQASQLVLAIDAPLAFPREFKQLLMNADSVFEATSSEITNPLAYRDCERWIYEQYGKKPLSASFDKLGNGASLAISMVHALKQDGFELMPLYAGKSAHRIIEVYPGLHKTQPKREAMAIEPVHRLIPSECKPGTDQYDAAICAILAAVYADCGDQLGLPSPVDFQEGFDREEGWVYSLPPDFISRYQR